MISYNVHGWRKQNILKIKIENFIPAPTENSWGSCQCKRFEPDWGEDELCKGLAIPSGLWSLTLCRQVSIYWQTRGFYSSTTTWFIFIDRFLNEKKDELLGVAANKIMRMTLNSGDHIKTWRFSTMKVSFPVVGFSSSGH